MNTLFRYAEKISRILKSIIGVLATLRLLSGSAEYPYCSFSCDVVKADVLQLSAGLHGSFDVVIMNPPFGTKKNAGKPQHFELIFVAKSL